MSKASLVGTPPLKFNPRKPPRWFWGPLQLTPRPAHLNVEFKIHITKEQASKLNPFHEKELSALITKWISQESELYAFRVSRCNLENPIREGVRSKFFGIIVVTGTITFEELHKSGWAYKLIALKTKIQSHVVEVSTFSFSRVRGVRRKKIVL